MNNKNKKSLLITSWFLIILFFISPISRSGVEIFTFFLLCSYLIYLYRNRGDLCFLKGDYFQLKKYILLYCLLILLTLVNAVNLREGIENFISEYFQYALTFVISLEIIKDKLIFKRLFSAFYISAFLVCIYGFVEYYYTGGARICSTFPNPNPAGTYYMIVALISLSILLWLKNVKVRLLSFLLGSLSFVSLVMSGSRGALLGFLFGVLFLIIKNILIDNKSIYKNLALVFLVLMLIVIPIVSNDNLINRFRNISGSEQQRVMMIRGGIEMLKAHPFLGVGTGQFRYVYEDYKESGAKVYTHIHNLYVHIAAETGFIGLFGFLFLVYKVISSVNYKKIQQKRWLHEGISAMIIATAVHSLFDWTFFSTQVGIFLMILLAIWINTINHLKLKLID